MKKQIGFLALLLATIAVVVIGCGMAPTQAETPTRFREVYHQINPGVTVVQDTATGACWVRTGVYSGTVMAPAPKEVCEAK